MIQQGYWARRRFSQPDILEDLCKEIHFEKIHCAGMPLKEARLQVPTQPCLFRTHLQSQV